MNAFFHCRFRDGSGVVVQTGEHPQHIAVHGGHRDAEADGRNGSRRVVPDAGQGAQGIIVGGQLSAVLLADDACSLLQVAHPAVVAKTLPEFVQLFLFAGGKGRNVRQGGEKAFVVGQCRRDPGLLQHDLAEPHMVWAGVGAEGQDAVVFVKPVQQGRGDIFHLFCAPYQKTGRRKVQQPGKSMRAYQKPYAVRGKGSTSRMFWMPVRYMIMRSKPKP